MKIHKTYFFKLLTNLDKPSSCDCHSKRNLSLNIVADLLSGVLLQSLFKWRDHYSRHFHILRIYLQKMMVIEAVWTVCVLQDFWRIYSWILKISATRDNWSELTYSAYDSSTYMVFAPKKPKIKIKKAAVCLQSLLSLDGFGPKITMENDQCPKIQFKWSFSLPKAQKRLNTRLKKASWRIVVYVLTENCSFLCWMLYLQCF